MKLLDFIVCDDIRREEGGKFTLVGVYNDKVEFIPLTPEEVKWPQNKQIGVYCRLVGEKSDFNFEKVVIIFSDNNKEVAIRLEGNIEEQLEQKPKKILVFSFVFGISIPKPATLYPKLQFINDDQVINEILPGTTLSFIARELSTGNKLGTPSLSPPEKTQS
ncbi:MAG: hypothetical protein NPINA01_25000 [Nitrospinaceae bacterium]|nr:MAG: hypothetical protein NPINA01_25000 [Nitrospinaceae bacterium]